MARIIGYAAICFVKTACPFILKDILIQTFDDFKKENVRQDDVTVVGFGLIN